MDVIKVGKRIMLNQRLLFWISLLSFVWTLMRLVGTAKETAGLVWPLQQVNTDDVLPILV
jgi:hypothetical protein